MFSPDIKSGDYTSILKLNLRGVSMIKDTKKLMKEIEKLKSSLRKKDLYENFGQKECRKLWDKYDDSYPEIRTLILAFEDWCMNYIGE